MKDIIIFGLLALCTGLSIWAIYLDNRVHQLLGYIDRLERMYGTNKK